MDSKQREGLRKWLDHIDEHLRDIFRVAKDWDGTHVSGLTPRQKIVLIALRDGILPLARHSLELAEKLATQDHRPGGCLEEHEEYCPSCVALAAFEKTASEILEDEGRDNG